MDFPNESLPILAGIISGSAKTLPAAMKYIYAVAEEDFYNVNIKDVFKLALMDVTDISKLENLGIDTNKKEINDIFSSEEFSKIQYLTAYHLAARIPFLKKQINDLPLKDKQLKQLHDRIINEGAANLGGIVYESFEVNLKLLKQKQKLPPFTSEWFRRYVYTYLPALAEINNRNLFFLGCVEALFPLYYSAVTSEIQKVIFLLQK